MTSVFKEEFVKKSEPLAEDDKIIQQFMNERYDIFIIMQSGRVFKKRARGQSGSYDNWVEVDLLKEIHQDLHI